MAARFFSRISCAFRAQTAHVLIVTAEPGQHIGRYKLLEAIGEGGIGVVYLAEQQEPMRRRIAWKFTRSGLETHYLFRLESEQEQVPGERAPQAQRSPAWHLPGGSVRAPGAMIISLTADRRITGDALMSHVSLHRKPHRRKKTTLAASHGRNRNLLSKKLGLEVLEEWRTEGHGKMRD